MRNSSKAVLFVPAIVGMFASCTLTSLNAGYDVGGAGGVGGHGTLCSPGETRSCYSGPLGTENKGICKAGVETCAPDGMSWGACAGEVLPQSENCATPEDEDCDGKAPPCTGDLLWAKSFGDVGSQVANRLATDAEGNVILVGSFVNQLNFGGGALQDVAASPALFIAKLDANGGHLWSKTSGAAGGQNGQYGDGLTVDDAGNIYIIGSFDGAIDLGGGALQSAGGWDVFVAKLDPNGGHLWSKRFGDGGDQAGHGVAIDNTGNVLLTGNFGGMIDLGGGALQGAGAGQDLFVAKLDSNGAHLWSKKFGDEDNQLGFSIGTDASNNVLVAGSFAGTLDMGGGELQSAGGLYDVFLAKLDPNGAHLWSHRFGDPNPQDLALKGLSVDATGDVLLFGSFTGTIDMGGGEMQSALTDIFLAKFNGDGAHLWSKRFGDGGVQKSYSVGVDDARNVLLTGFFDGEVNFGGGPLASLGDDIYLAKFSTEGAHLWSKRFGSVDVDVGADVASDNEGNVFVTGIFASTLDFGDGPLQSAGGKDIFIAKLAP